VPGLIVDLDDFTEQQHRLDLLEQLHQANPLFRCTLFAIPALGTDSFWESVPEWCELAVHGWQHGDPAVECARWGYQDMHALIVWVERHLPRFAHGFKAPGWQISDGCYEALADADWWIADQHLEDDRRPKGLRTYFYEDSDDRWHGHIQDVCGNGLAETFSSLLARVKEATSFELVSEAVQPWA
jgi:hypothetical protein